tara:strand:- start:836 stop:1408 length:573 start_codon:yes stop_codon:yes gene_type:complete
MISKWNFTNVIKLIPTYVGCNDFPNGVQGEQLKAIISEFINEQFPLLKPDDITEAFKMAAGGKLIENGKKIEPNTYGQLLSAALVGKILAAYVTHKRDANARPKGYNPMQLDEYKPLITAKQSWEVTLELALKDGEPPLACPYLGAYKYLVEQGKLQPVKKASKQSFMSEMCSPERQAVEKYLKQTILKQ